MVRTIAVLLAVTSTAIVFSQPASAADCQISAFQTKDEGQQSELSVWSFFYSMTKGEWENYRKSISGSAGFGLIGVDMTYDEMHNTAKTQLTTLKVDSMDQSAKSWSTTMLTDNGLKAYLHCQGGLAAEFSSLDGKGGKVNLSWDPPPGWRKRMSVTQSKNIENISNIKNIIRDQYWFSKIDDYEIAVRKKDSSQPAELSIGGHNYSRVIYVPAEIKLPVEDVSNYKINPSGDSCNTHGNHDNVFCTVFAQSIPADPKSDGQIVIQPDLSLDITVDHEASDPHRFSYVDIKCGDGTQVQSPYLGQQSVDHATPHYGAAIVCQAHQGKQTDIQVQVNPRGGSIVLASGDLTIRQRHRGF